MHRILIVALALGAVACSDRKGSEGGKKPAQTEAKQAATKTAQTKTGEKKAGEATPPAPPLKPLLGEARAGLPEPLAALRFDMTRAQVYAAVPQLKEKDEFTPEGFPGVEVGVDFHAKEDRLRYAWATLPSRAKADLVAAWGEPVEATLSRDRTALFWLDADRGVQAVLTPRVGAPDMYNLELWPFTPWQSLLGPDAETLGFESTPLLGMTPAQVQQTYAHLRPRRDDGRVDLWLPGYEYRTSPTRVRLQVEDGKVAQVYFKLDYGHHPQMGEAIEAALTEKWGEPEKQAENAWRFRAGDTAVEVSHIATARQYAFRLTPAKAAAARETPPAKATP